MRGRVGDEPCAAPAPRGALGHGGPWPVAAGCQGAMQLRLQLLRSPSPAAYLLGLPHLDHRHAGDDRVGVLRGPSPGALYCRLSCSDAGGQGEAVVVHERRQAARAAAVHSATASQVAARRRTVRSALPHRAQPKMDCRAPGPTSRAAELMVSLAPMTMATSKPSISGFTCSSHRATLGGMLSGGGASVCGALRLRPPAATRLPEQAAGGH